ncbi:MAG: hypothetical protein PWQ22_582 [Archaeoglobaceae archaeon]|nr:hypothetical protein [Archaeoglobaceae archaeon]
MNIREDRLKELEMVYGEKTERYKDFLLGKVALILLRVKAMSGTGYRNFLVVVSPPEGEETLPKMLIFHDNRCAYCGKALVPSDTVSVKDVKCLVCGKEPSEHIYIICTEGHYICNSCYEKETGKILLPLTIESIVKNYENIKEHIVKRLESGAYNDLPQDIRKAVAFRDTLYGMYEYLSMKFSRDVEVILLTNALIPMYGAFFRKCLHKCDELCEPVRKILKEEGILEG